MKDLHDEIGCALFNLTAFAMSKGLTDIAASLESVAARHHLVPKLERAKPHLKVIQNAS